MILRQLAKVSRTRGSVQGQFHVETKPVGAHVQIVEPAASGPQELGPDGIARTARGNDLFAVRKLLLKGFRLGQSQFLEDIFAVVHAPLIVGIGHTILLAVDGQRTFDRLKPGQIAVGIHIRDVFEQPGRDIRAHAVRGIPVDHIGRVRPQGVPDLRLPRFAVDDRQFDIDVRMQLSETGCQTLHHRARRGVRHVRGDLELP